MLKQKVYLLPENLSQLNNVNIGLQQFLLLFLTVYLFQLLVHLDSDFNCCK